MPPAARFRESDPSTEDLLARSVNDTTSSPVRKSKRVFIAGTPVGPLRRTPLKSPRVSEGAFALQDFYVTPPPPSSPLRRGVSPTRTTSVAETDNLLSPWRIRVRVEAERDNDGVDSKSHFSVSPTRYPAPRTVTTTVPLRGGDSSPPAKRGRGRPRKSDTAAPRRKGTPRPNKTRRLSQEELEREDLEQLTSTPKRSPGRPRKSIETDGTPKQTTPAKSPMPAGTSTTKSKRGRRKAMGPVNIAPDEEIDDEGMAEPIAFADDDGFAILPNEEMMEEVLQIDDVPSEDELDELPGNENDRGAEADEVQADSEPNSEEFDNVDDVESAEDGNTGELPSRAAPISPLQPRSPISPQKGRRRRSLLSQKSDVDNEDPTNYHREYDSIMESEGFSMVSLNTLPSAQHLRLQAVIEEESEPPLPDSSQLSEELRTDYDPTGEVPDVHSSLLANAVKHITPLKPAASPALPPPPKVVVTNMSPRALDKPNNGTPKLVRVVRAGIALQGVVDEDEPQDSEPSKKLVAPSSASKSPRERLDALFSGFGAGTQRELRAGLRLGEELAKRQRLAKQASHRAWVDEDDGDVFSDKVETPGQVNAHTPQQYSLNVPGPRNPTPSAGKSNEQLPSPEDSGEVPDDDMMSWRLDTPRQAQLAAAAKQASVSPRRNSPGKRVSFSPQRVTNATRASSSPQHAMRTKRGSSSPQRMAAANKASSSPQRGNGKMQVSMSPQRATKTQQQASSSPQQGSPTTRAKIAPKTQAQREAEWNEERKAVSQQIRSADQSQVMVINSDDPTPSALREVDEEESEDDVPPPEPTIDIWQEEAKTSSHLSFAKVEEPRRDDPNDMTKPPRSKLPTPWRRQSNTQLVYSDEADMEEPSWIKRKAKRPSPTSDASPENRKRARFSSPVEQPSPERQMSDEVEMEESPTRPLPKTIPASVEKRVRQQLLGDILGAPQQVQKTPPRKQPQPTPIAEERSESEDEDINETPPTEEDTLPQQAIVQPSPPQEKQSASKSATPQLAEPAEIEPKSQHLEFNSTERHTLPNIETSSNSHTQAETQTQAYDTLAGWVQSVASLPTAVSNWFVPSTLSSLSRLAFRPPASPTRAVSQPGTTKSHTSDTSTRHTTAGSSRTKSRRSRKSRGASEPFSLYLPWNLTHYRRLNQLYLDSLSHPSSYPLSTTSPTASLLGTEVFSMGWRKAMSALELGVADAFLALLRREGVDDLRGRQPRVDEHEVVKRVFSLWVGRVQRNETPLHQGVAGDWNERYKHLRKTQLTEQKRWKREKARLDAERAPHDLPDEQQRSPPHRRVQQLRADLL